MNREELLILLGKRGKQSVDAAVRLVLEALNPDDGIQETVLNVEVAPVYQGNSVAIRVGLDTNQVTASLDVGQIRQFANSRDQLATLALREVISLGDVMNRQISETQRRPLPCLDDLKAASAGTVDTDHTKDLLRRLRDSTSVALIGGSASGKTVSASQTAVHLSQDNWTVTWVDLSEPDRDVFDVLLSACRTPVGRASSHLLVVDDAQSNPRETTQIGAAVESLARLASCPIVVLLLGWESVSALVREAFPAAAPMSCQGNHVLATVVRDTVGHRLKDQVLMRIRQMSGGDLLIAKLMAETWAGKQRLPTSQEIQASAFQAATQGKELSNETIRLLYVLASLSQLEIDIARSYAEAIEPGITDVLIDLRCVKQNGDYLSVGHRSLARLILLHLERTSPSVVADLPSSANIAVEYIRGAAPQQIVATLERLDLAGLAYRDEDQHGTTFLAKAWESLLILVNYIARQASIDPTWGDNTASACFAAQAFAETGHERWQVIADYIHHRWQIDDDGSLPKPIGTAPSERIDFDEIKKAMRTEEATGKTYPSTMVHSCIDFDRMHRSWIMGQLLGFEGTARKPRLDMIASLKKAAEATQEPDGSFYPYRVPWVTARILIGLSLAGESIRTGDVVKKACDWLRRPIPEGPYGFGTWEPGTGSWNTVLGTTSMCLNALIRCGVPTEDECVQTSAAYLLAKRDEWTHGGQEIDGAFAMETILAVRGHWRDISTDLAKLLAWVRDREPWTKATQLASDAHAESCEVAQVASSLIGIVWETVRDELPLLLEGLSLNITTEELPEESLDQGTWQKVAAAINHLESVIQEHVRERERAIEKLGGGDTDSSIRDALKAVRQRRTRLGELATKVRPYIDSPSLQLPREELELLLGELDELGRQTLPGSWDPVLRLPEVGK